MKEYVWYIVNADNFICTDFDPINLGLSLMYGVFEVDKVIKQNGAEILSFRSFKGDVFEYVGEL